MLLLLLFDLAALRHQTGRLYLQNCHLLFPPVLYLLLPQKTLETTARGSICQVLASLPLVWPR